RVLVVRTVGGRHQVQYVAADLPQGAAAPQDVAVRALDAQVDVEPADGVETEAVVEQADERADGARGVVVLGAGQQQGAASLDVAEVDVVAERRAAHPTARVHDEDGLGLGVVPHRGAEHSDVRAGADRGQHGGPGERRGG